MASRLKILIVDDEPDFSAMLSRAIRKLGHDAVIAHDPEEALERIDRLGRDIDGVITDIDMPGMNGLELARAIRQRGAEVPIVFCSGSIPGTRSFDEAELLGKVFTKMWAIAQVREVVDGMARAAGERAAPAARSRRMATIRIRCRTWDLVNKLCDAQSAGRPFVSMRAPRVTRPGDQVAVSLGLPDAGVLTLMGTVASVRHEGLGNEAVCFVELTGLTPDLCARLRELGQAEPPLAEPHAAGSLPGLPPPARFAEGTEVRRSVSELIIGNLRLRRQIESLPGRMRPRRKTEPMGPS